MKPMNRPDLLHHVIEGADRAPVLFLGPSLGTSTALWDRVAPGLTAFRRVRWDLPGHGHSPAGLLRPGATVADLAAHVLRLADSLGLERFHYAGVSLGGAVGLWLAAYHPDRLDRLAVVCSSARFGEPGPWRERAALVRREGTAPVAATAASRWFTPAFTGDALARHLVDDLRRADPSAYAACCDALAAYDLRAALPDIATPTLVLAGTEDPATPPAHAHELAATLPDATLTELPGASHLAPAERPDEVLAALLLHFAG
ncbi:MULTISPECIES: alpha/beta fold hydrolase [unclassified Streptomyces]|uniref:alpha/beta fold hydrolase n=1 Tax=unclassified Streptomyces TaxID=2593676 RepID=UPI0033AED892